MNLFSILSLSFPLPVGACMCTVLSNSLHPYRLCPPGFSVHGIFQQESWSGLPFPSPGDLPNPGIKSASLASPALAGGFFTAEPPGKHIFADSRLYMLKYH